jgi:hypothetical protein
MVDIRAAATSILSPDIREFSILLPYARDRAGDCRSRVALAGFFETPTM